MDYTALKTYIEGAYPALVAAPTTANAALIAEDLSKLTEDFYIWDADLSAGVIFDSIVWANLTPTDAPDGTQQWMNRSLACQGKQFNIQTMLAGRASLDFTRTSIRAGVQDALSNVPSGAGGVAVSAGWVTVRDAAKKLATGLQKALATGTGTRASPAVANNPATIGFNEVFALMGW